VNRGRHDTPRTAATSTSPSAAVKLQDGVVAGRTSIGNHHQQQQQQQQHSSAHACAAADAKLPGGVPMAGVRQSNV